MTPNLSVIIPCFNSETLIPSTLESVFTQTYQDFEIIVIDDESTDQTVSLLKSYGNKIRFYQQEHLGVSAARNLGTFHARGQWIQYLDSDDLLLPHAFEHRLKMAQGKNFDRTVIYSGWKKWIEVQPGKYQEGGTVKKALTDFHADSDLAIFSGFWCPPVAVLYPLEIVKKIGTWNESLPIIQDARFMLDAALQGADFQFTHDVDSLYRVPLNPSLSRRHPNLFALDIYRNAQDMLMFWNINSALDQDRYKAVVGCFEYTAREP